MEKRGLEITNEELATMTGEEYDKVMEMLRNFGLADPQDAATEHRANRLAGATLRILRKS